MKVSVICPTYNRPALLGLMYDLFTSQSYPDKELLIYDDSPEPHPSLHRNEDPSLHYIHIPKRAPIGQKRNCLIDAARGDVIVHFDDDDFYVEHYIATMVRWLEHCDFVTLSSWFAMHSPTRRYYYWQKDVLDDGHFRLNGAGDPTFIDIKQRVTEPGAWIDCQLWGYGFSYVFRRDVTKTVRFDDAHMAGEDLAFLGSARAAGFSIKAFADTEGLALHVVHAASTSRIFPNYRVPAFMVERQFGTKMSEYLTSACGGTA